MKKNKRYKIRWERVIIALGLFIGIGLIPIHFINVRTDEAKVELAKELLNLSVDYPEQTKDILKQAANDPKFAGRNLHVWSNPYSRRSYDTYVGGGLKWLKTAYVVPNTGEQAAKVIIADDWLNTLLRLIAVTWYATPILAIAWHILNKNEF